MPAPPQPTVCFETFHHCPPILKIDSLNILEGIPELLICKYFRFPSSGPRVNGKHSMENMSQGWGEVGWGEQFDLSVTELHPFASDMGGSTV